MMGCLMNSEETVYSYEICSEAKMGTLEVRFKTQPGGVEREVHIDKTQWVKGPYNSSGIYLEFFITTYTKTRIFVYIYKDGSVYKKREYYADRVSEVIQDGSSYSNF
jgi:hypothetical protein